MKIHDVTMTSCVDGEGIRTVIWFQGCHHNCPGCQNPQTWDETGGVETDSRELARQIQEWRDRNRLKELHVTFSGGEPFDQAKDASDLAELLNPDTLWIYTGYTLEQLLRKSDPHITALLEKTTILIDGRYEEKTPPRQAFVGSGNQRILDIQLDADSKIAGCSGLPDPTDKDFSDKIQRMVITDKYTLPEGYVYSSKTRTADTCPNCNRVCTEDEPFERIRRITGYLVGTLARFNAGKKAEESDRIKHA